MNFANSDTINLQEDTDTEISNLDIFVLMYALNGETYMISLYWAAKFNMICMIKNPFQ